MPAPKEPSKWLRCAPSCVPTGESQSRLHSLTSLEEQLEISFGQLRQRLSEVHEELASSQAELPEMDSYALSSVRSLVMPHMDGSSNALESAVEQIPRPSMAMQSHSVLEVPAVLARHASDPQDSMSRSVWIAADRAKAMSQAVDLVTLSSGSQPLRLHPRWMEMVNKSNLIFMGREQRKSKKKLGFLRMHKTLSNVEAFSGDNENDYLLKQRRPKVLLLPHQPFRLGWDIVGLFLIMVDAFLLPMSLAWDIGIEPVDIGSTINCVCFFVALFFWSCDVCMNFNTGFYHNGRLVLDRCKIACNYMQGWLTFDLMLISLDAATAIYQYGTSGGSTLLRGIRALRVLRAFRLLRLLKMSRLSAVIEEASVAAGRQWMVLVVAIVNTTLTMLICAHVLACLWYWLGRDRMENNQVSWLDEVHAADVAGHVQYLHALQWVLTPPSPPVVAADSAFERVYCIFIVGCTVVVIGSALSKITGTLAELRTINSEGSRRRREVRQYLHAQRVSVELTSRIMRFVDYKLERQSSVALDPSLLSPSLRVELHVSQRGHLLAPHPLFQLTHEIFPEVFASICGAVEKHVFGKMEMVFTTESWAHCMWITATGRFVVIDGGDLDLSQTSSLAGGFTGCQWFAEAALFAEAVTHDASLRAQTFGEAFSLKGADLAATLMNSPDCTALFCEYGKDLLTKLAIERRLPTWRSSQAQDVTRACLNQNSYYQEVHPDPRTLLENVNLFQDSKDKQNSDTTQQSAKTLASKVNKGFGRVLAMPSRMLRRSRAGLKRDPAKINALWSMQMMSINEDAAKEAPKDALEEVALDEDAQEYGDGKSETEVRKQKRQVKVVSMAEFPLQNDSESDGWGGMSETSNVAFFSGKLLQQLAEGVLEKKISVADALDRLGESIPELLPEKGTHVVFSQNGEREKSESCCVSLMALLLGSYEDYTRPQGEQVRLTQKQWGQLQQLVSWTRPTVSKIKAVLVLLAIRALGKSKRITQQLPDVCNRPEKALLYLMRNYTNVVPSVMALEEEELELISEAMEVHQDFNLAQMLQGENVPASVLQLQELVRRLGTEIFRFYILFLLGFMSGLAGGNGSRFMNARNAGSVIAGMTTLLHIFDSSPQAIYWGYIQMRARQLSLPCDSREDMALVRLGCLARVQDEQGFKSLRTSWELLGLRERQLLVLHFLADGIDEQAFVCEFLPDCVAKARDNKNIGLHLLLEVLVDLIEHLHLTELKTKDQKVKMVTVDLSDMAEFIGVVQSRFIFSTCISRSRLQVEDSRWYLQMTSSNWSRTHEADNDTTTLAYGLQEVLQRQKFMQEVLSSRGR